MKTRTTEDLGRASHAELVRLVVELLERVEVLEAENAALKARNAKLEEQVRASKRARAPFSKGKDKADPKKPGRCQRRGDLQQAARA